jgi:hypothetical protein
VSTTFPPLEPDRYGWAELLSLVGSVDTFDVYDGRIDDQGGSA